MAHFAAGAASVNASFYTWRKRLSEESPLKFALVETGMTANAGPGLELVLTNGERLRIDAGADATTLRIALSVLRERP